MTPLSPRMDKAASEAVAGRVTKIEIAREVSGVLGDDGIVFNERGAPAHAWRLARPERVFSATPRPAVSAGACRPHSVRW